jgi:fucose 4-O-acetylase-like acetyltransferase
MTERVMTPPAEPSTAPVRSTLVDIVKGLAIMLVVYGHTAEGVVHRLWWTGPSSWISDLFVYSFHMPVFFFVAGLFITGSLQRRGSGHFVTDKVKTVLYPYVLWMVVSASIEPLIGRFKMGITHFDWRTFLAGLLDGEISWFLPVLFVCQLLALCTWKVPGWLRLGVALIAAVTMQNYGPSVLYKPLHEFCYMAAGMIVGRGIFKLAKVPVWQAAVGAVLIFAAQMEIIIHDGGKAQYGQPHQWLAVLLGFTGTLALLLLARTLDHTRFGAAWAWLGEASLAIFLLSPFAQGAVRELLLRFAHTHELLIQLIVPTIFAAVLPAIVWHQQKRWRIGWLFRWPSL